MKKMSGAGILFLLLSVYCSTSRGAITPGSTDPTFHPPSLQGDVRVILVQPDGKIVIGGGFTIARQPVVHGIACLNADGSFDETFLAGSGIEGTNSYVSALARQSDGKILLGGNFSMAAGLSNRGLARLNVNGSADTTFTSAYGSDETISSIALYGDGRILAGSAGTDAVRRFDSLGNRDANFVTQFYTYANVFFNTPPSITSIALLPNNQILAGGYLGSFQIPTDQGVWRLTSAGAQDRSFTPAVGSVPSSSNRSISSVNGLIVQGNGSILVFGQLNRYPLSDSSVGAPPRYALARLGSDGTFDASFQLLTNQTINAMGLQADGKVLAGGLFNNIAGNARTNLVRLNKYGMLDASFNASTDGSVQAIATQSDGKILIGGSFASVNGGSAMTLARLNGDDTTPRAPTISIQPISLALTLGTNAVFFAVADGYPLSYQWQLNGSNVPGATNDTLFLENINGSNNGIYRVVVSNPLGTVVSTNATLVADLTLGESLALAVDSSGLVWTTGGDSAGWVATTEVSHDGFDAVRNTPNPNTVLPGTVAPYLQTTIRVPGTLSFWWREIGSAIPAAMTLKMDGATAASILSGGQGGSDEWEFQTVAIPSGTHTLAWVCNTLRVSARIDEVHFAPPSIQWRANTVNGADYAVESSTNLTDWVRLRTFTAGTNEVLLSQPIDPSFSRAFFRAVKLNQ